MNKALRFAVWLLVLSALMGVFMSYLNPHVVRDLATQLWACF